MLESLWNPTRTDSHPDADERPCDITELLTLFGEPFADRMTRSVVMASPFLFRNGGGEQNKDAGKILRFSLDFFLSYRPY